jgi:hypothetical protein
MICTRTVYAVNMASLQELRNKPDSMTKSETGVEFKNNDRKMYRGCKRKAPRIP